jgi:RNA polymerase sigma-70 factor (ECF subfamily)
MDTDHSDEAWIGGVREHRAEIIAELRDYLRRTLAKGFGRQLQDADLDDLTQECMLRVQHKLDTFAGQSRFTTWAATIAVNTALSALRKRRHQHVSIEEAGERADWSPDEDDDDHRIALLRQGIEQALTARQREAIQAALGGLPLMELARRYDVSQGAVYKLLHDARQRLKHFLEAAEHRHAAPGAPS